MKNILTILAALFVSPSMAFSADEAAKPPRSRLLIMLETKFVSGHKLKGPIQEYKPDRNPNTIELVGLPKGDGSESSVSDDGQVIFLSEKDLRSGDVRQDLMDKAFEIIEQKEKESASK